MHTGFLSCSDGLILFTSCAWLQEAKKGKMKSDVMGKMMKSNISPH